MGFQKMKQKLARARAAFRRIIAGYGAMALYYLFRLLACLPPLFVLYSDTPSDEYPGFHPGLLVVALLLIVLVSIPYTVLLRSLMTGGHEAVRQRRAKVLIVSVGAADILAGLILIMLSDGWASPFRHLWFTALLVPCLVLGLRRSLVLGALSVAAFMVTMSVSGGDGAAVQLGTHYQLMFSTAVTIFLVCGIIGYLGDVTFALQRSRHKAESTLRNLETVFEITRNMAAISSGVNDSMRRMAHIIGERHRCHAVGIYLLEPGGRDVRLSGWLGDFDDLDGHARQDDHLIHQALSSRDAIHTQAGQEWNAAIPIAVGDSPMGVLLMGSQVSVMDVRSATFLGETLAGHIAIGIQVARLRQRLDYAATPHEWDRLTRQIHDGISGSIYSLLLHLETYSELARDEDSSLSEGIDGLLPPTRQLLIDARQYMYHLLPALRGESGLDRIVESLMAEFERVSGIEVSMSLSGSASGLDILDILGFHRALQFRLAEILSDGTASGVNVELGIESGNIRLVIWDDGIDDADGAQGRRERMRRRLGDLGGDLRIIDSYGAGTRIEIALNTGNGGESLDQPGNH